MDISALQYFVYIAHKHTYEETAVKYNISASSVSKAIKKLEEELNTVLFDRVSRSMRLTRSGTLCLNTFESMVAQYESLLSSLDYFTPNATIRVCSTSSIVSLGLIDAFHGFRAENPGHEIALTNSHNYENSIADLRNGLYDFFITYDVMEQQPDLRYHILFTEPIYCICSTDSPLAEKHTVNIMDLAGYKALSTVSSNRWLINQFSRYSQVEHSQQFVDDALSHVALSSDIMISSQSDLRGFSDLRHVVKLPIEGMEKTPVVMAYLASKKMRPLHEEFIRYITGYCKTHNLSREV